MTNTKQIMDENFTLKLQITDVLLLMFAVSTTLETTESPTLKRDLNVLHEILTMTLNSKNVSR